MRRLSLFVLSVFLLIMTVPFTNFAGEMEGAASNAVPANEQGGTERAFILSEETTSVSDDSRETAQDQEQEALRHNYILVIDNSRSTTGAHSLGTATDPEGLRFDAARLVYDNVLSSASLGSKGQMGVIIFCGPENCMSYGPLDIDSDPRVLAEAIGNYLSEEPHEGHRDNYTDIRTALQTASSMMDGFSGGSDTSVILLTDGINDLTNQGDPFLQTVNTQANDDSVELVESIYQKGADFYVVALTTETAVQHTEAFLVFINRMAAAGGGEMQEDGSYSNVLLATQSDLNSKLLQMLIKAESSSDSIQNIIEYTPLQETFTVPYAGITDATVNITFMPEDKEHLDKVELAAPSGEELILWDQEGAHEQQGIRISEERSYIILEIPSPEAGDWNIIVTERVADVEHPVLINVVVRFNHNIRLQADPADSFELGQPAAFDVRFQTWNGTEFEDLADSDIYSQSTAQLFLWAPGNEEPLEAISMEQEADHYTANFTPDATGEWKARVLVENPYVKTSTDDLVFEVKETLSVILPENISLSLTPSIVSDDGIAYLAPDAGLVALAWDITGETDSVEAALLKNGKIIHQGLKGGEVIDTRKLEAGVEYAMQVTVMPKNGEATGADPIVETLPFQLAPEVIPIQAVTLDIQPRIEDRDDMFYIDKEADAWTVSWTIDGEADAVNAAIYEEGSDEPLLRDLASGDEIADSILQEGKTYLLRLEAIPKNGLLSEAEPFTQELVFQFYPEAGSVTGLMLEAPDGNLADGVYTMKKSYADLTWNLESGNVDHFDLHVTDPQGNDFLQTAISSSSRNYTLEMDQPGEYRVKLTAVPRYARNDEMNASSEIVVSPHIPGFIEKYWPFLAGGAGLLILIAAGLLILKAAKAPRIFGSLQIDCEEPELTFHKHLDFIPDRQGLKYGDPLTAHPLLASMTGQKVYDILKNVRVSMVTADSEGKIPGAVEDGDLTHRPNASVISLTYKDPKSQAASACYVGQYDIGTSTMVLKDSSGKEYTFRFGNTAHV